MWELWKFLSMFVVLDRMKDFKRIPETSIVLSASLNGLAFGCVGVFFYGQ